MSAKNKGKKDTQFKKDLKNLGVDESIIENIMEIHRNNPHLVPYECKRLYNIKRNEEILNKLNLTKIKSVMKPPKRKYQKRTLKEKTILSPRKSSRISEMKPVQYNDESDDYIPEQTLWLPRPMPSNPKLTFDEIVDHGKSDPAGPILDVLKKAVDRDLLVSKTVPEIKQESTILNEFKNLRLDQSHTTQICSNQVSSMAIHPGNKLIAASGSVRGEVGLFMPGKDKVTLRLKPHSSTIGGCHFSWNKLFTCSYDSTVRMFDSETLQYNQLYSASPEVWFRSLDLCNENELMVAGTDGQIIKVDVRENKKVCSYPAKANSSEYGSLWGLHHNKYDTNYFLSTSSNGTIAAWDHRSTKYPVDINMSHKTAVFNAMFDPIRGKRVVSVGKDDKICILDFSDKAKFTEIQKFGHRNAGGQSNATKFQAKWHPFSDTLFAIGAMAKKPRCIEIFNIKGQFEGIIGNAIISSSRSLPLVEFHPSQNALVCGNGNGQCYFFHGN